MAEQAAQCRGTNPFDAQLSPEIQRALRPPTSGESQEPASEAAPRADEAQEPQKETPPEEEVHPSWPASRIWAVATLALWVIISIAAVSASFIGGVFLSVIGLIIWAVAAQLPDFFSEGWSGSGGKAV